MRIILIEIRGERRLGRHEFKQPIIKIGSDAQRNDLVFDRSHWPSVSRLHAEIQFEEGHCQLTDLGSTNGTFLNGRRISATTEIQVGSTIQVGQEGPALSVELIEPLDVTPRFGETFIDEDAAKHQHALWAQAQSSKVESSAVVSKVPVDTPNLGKLPSDEPPAPDHHPQPVVLTDRAPANSSPILICENGPPNQIGRRFVLEKDRMVLGRDVAADISIDEAAAGVSRRHAELLRRDNGDFEIVDLNSFNGTLVNNQRIMQSIVLHDGDRVQLALGGPIFLFIDAAARRPKAPGPRPTVLPSSEISNLARSRAAEAEPLFHTIVSQTPDEHSAPAARSMQLLFQRTFDGKQHLSVGRGSDNDIRLNGLLISEHHARFINTPTGVLIEDAGSTNGVYLNGGRVKGRRPVQSQDVVQIGPFILKADPAKVVAVFDTRSKTRIDAIAITDVVKRRSGLGPRKLLDEVSLAIQPNEFVGVLGPSGAGKSLLISALNGRRRTTSGRILVNNLDLYHHVDSLKQSIGYVPQDDIIHRELTVYRTLYYVARLRLSRDVGANEIDQIIGEVLDVTGLNGSRDVLVSQLSGGQRKRVSIAVELITKPSVIFLDEPTSGLDPATEERIMKLFRQIAESGHTVILTTHAMENVRLFDRVVLLLGGKLIFYGAPAEALEFFGTNNFIDLYNKLEAPVEAEVERLDPLPAKATRAEKRAYELRREKISDAVSEYWRSRYTTTEMYVRYIGQPISLIQQEMPTSPPKHHGRGVTDGLRQWATLVRRYAEVIASDRWNLLILFSQGPIIGLLMYLVVGKNDPRDFLYFIFALVSIWFGTSVAARELVKERQVFSRERMVNLRLMPYVASKLFILSFIVGLQTTLLFGTVKILDYVGLIYLPGFFFGLPLLLVMTLTGIVGIAIGLFISALVRTSEVATSLVPLILIPQILFAGLITVPTGASKVIGAAMPATWSFDEIKRLSFLDTLKDQGSDPNGVDKGRGLYRHIEELNSENVKNARNQINDYSKRASEVLGQPDRGIKSAASSHDVSPASAAKPPETLKIGPPPSIPDPEKINENLSGYVSFKHPWGGLILDPVILFTMLFTLLLATLIALRVKDVR